MTPPVTTCSDIRSTSYLVSITFDVLRRAQQREAIDDVSESNTCVATGADFYELIVVLVTECISSLCFGMLRG